ncbi:hypothetical protein WJX72_009199 [[Myrmecia] bisecta]|uniref:Protein phosphatase n=1 Tax=[Myrmecia] bisecta TaxID=41462 RepID=A0AAW1P8X9_9CHLO
MQGKPLYRVDIVTGDVRGAGTTAPAVIRLIGEEGQSEEYVLGNDQDAYGFERSTTKSYSLDVGRHIGSLRRIHVHQVPPSSTELGTGWFLDRIEVTSSQGGSWRFPCNSWLGKSDAGDVSGCMERNLIPSDGTTKEPETPHLDRPLVIRASAVTLPHPEKVNVSKGVNRRNMGWGGEDAYFYTEGRNGIYGLGVADGVYMWRTQGIDAGLFSRDLMQTARSAIENGKTDVLKVVQAAARRVQQDGLQGSSTICVTLIDTRQGRLTNANIGDSGLLLIGTTHSNQQMHIKYRSPQQEHSFGCPYQLGHHPKADAPETAMLTTVPVAPGDVVILGTDGLFDNLSDEQILAEVREQHKAGAQPTTIARHLTFKAFDNSMDKHSETPYSLAASEAFDMVYSGGKADDITVVVAVIS